MGHGFEDECAWHGGLCGEIALDPGVHEGDVFDADGAFPVFPFNDAVDEEEGISVWNHVDDLI